MRQVATLAVFLLGTVAAAQEPPFVLPRLAGAITIDGTPDEEAWQAIPPLPLTEYAPTYRGEPAQKTEIRVAYDDAYLYAAGWFWDDDPRGIRVNSLYRDRWNGDDAFAIYVDGFNDNRNAKWFGTTPGGIRFDQLVSDDGATLNESWDGFWDAKTTITGEGWFAEVRIPLSTLGFRDEDGRALMGLTVTRLVSRSGERVTFPDIDPRFEFRAPSHARKVLLTGVRGKRPLYLTPYVLGGVQRVSTDAGRSARDTSGDVGGDLRYALSGTLNLDLTVRTDFAQVEADEEQVALDRFPLFYPEKRRFFQEGSGVFDFVTTGGGRLFHSRQIGLTEDRQPVPVVGGARLVGRAGAWDVGLLDMQTEAQGRSPRENFGVARVRRNVVNPFSYVGAMVTSRAASGRTSVSGGADGLFRFPLDHYLTLLWAGTTGSPTATLASRSLFEMKWQRRTNRGLSYTLETMRNGRDYRPELGFLPRSDVTVANASANWFFFTDKSKRLRRVYPGFIAFNTFRNATGVLESGQYATWVEWDTKAGGGGWVEPKLFHENVAAPFTIAPGLSVPKGSYDFADLQLVYSMPSGARLRTDVDVRAGTYFDGTRRQSIVSPTWNASRHLELSGSWQWTHLDFKERAQEGDVHVASLQVRVARDARASANAMVQYNSASQRVGLNLRLRYNMAEGTDLWLVYDEGLDTERTRAPGEPLAPLSASRALIVKYTRTFAR